MATLRAEWCNKSDVFETRGEAELNGYQLAAFSVIGGSNTETYPYGWEVCLDGDEVDQGAAVSMRDAAQQAETAALKGGRR